MGKPVPNAPAPAPAAVSADAPAKVEKPKKPKTPKQSIRLRDNAKNTLVFIAKQKEKGSVSYAVYSTPKDADGKTTRQRGASASHENFDAAKAAIAAGAEAAKKLGWAQKASRSGGSKSDVFSLENLPTPKQ